MDQQEFTKILLDLGCSINEQKSNSKSIFWNIDIPKKKKRNWGVREIDGKQVYRCVGITYHKDPPSVQHVNPIRLFYGTKCNKVIEHNLEDGTALRIRTDKNLKDHKCVRCVRRFLENIPDSKLYDYLTGKITREEAIQK